MVTVQKVYIRNSEKSDFQKCEQMWWWAWVEQIKPRHTRGYFTFGDMIHQSLAKWYKPGYKRGPHPAQTFGEIYDAYGEEYRIRETDTEEKIRARDLGVEMMTNYVDHYGRDKHIKVLYPEMPFEVDIYSPGGIYLYTVVGTSDALIFNNLTGELGLFEHKTAASIRTNHLFMDEQATMYWTYVPIWLMQHGILKDLDDLKFMLFNFMRKAMKDIRPENAQGHKLNKDGSVSKIQPAPLFVRAPVYRGEVERQHMQVRTGIQVRRMQALRAGKVPVVKSPGLVCTMCIYADMCESHEVGGDWESLRELEYKRWDPYADHTANEATDD